MTQPLSEHALNGRVGGFTRWSRTSDRTAATAPARAAFLARFERQVDPDGSLPDEERQLRARAAMQAHMATLNAKRVLSRRRRQRRSRAA